MAATDIDKMAYYTSTRDGGLLALESPTTTIAAGSSTAVSGVSIGFTFYFDGVAYTTCEIHPAGVVQFAGTISANNVDLFAANTDVMIAPWYDDFSTLDTTGYVKTETLGTAPFRRFVIEWKVRRRVDSIFACDIYTFQLALYETTDKHEFRYGARVTNGAGGSAPTASRGVKGDTSGVADNFRDAGFPLDALPLGAGKVTTFGSLVLDNVWYDSYVGDVFVGQPNWPMCGRAFLINPDELTGHIDYERLLWLIANFVNWLRCYHQPPLINIAPYQQTGYANVTYIVPCQPSYEGIDYTFYLQVYASTGATCTVSISRDIAADPQVSIPGDWGFAGGPAAVVVAGWNGIAAFDVPIASTTTHIRIDLVMSAGTVILGSLLAVPKALDDIDETATSLIGWTPMAIGQLLQDGAAVHAEWFNRAWRDIAVDINDRRQMVWSSVWPELSLVSLAATTAKPVRTIGVSKASLPKRGQECTARIYARDTTGGAKLQIAEAGNALLAEWTVAASGGEYRAQSTAVDLFSQEPAITATCAPVGTLSPMFVGLEWAPAMSTDNLFQGVTPAPSLAKLFALAARMEQALRAYCYAGNATMLARGKTSSNPWYVQAWVPPAVYALHARIARDADDHTAPSLVTSIFGVTSGAAPADEIRADSPHSSGRDDYPPEGAIGFGTTSGEYNAAPIAAGYRPLESPTATTMANGVRERVTVVRGVGITFVPILADAASL